MAFTVTVYVPEGIVMAADSRQMMTLEGRSSQGEKLPPVQTIASDHADNLFLFKTQRAALSTWGNALLTGRRKEAFLRKVEAELLTPTDTVVDTANKLMAYFKEHVGEPNAPFQLSEEDGIAEVTDKLTSYFGERTQKRDAAFHLAGYAQEQGESVPYVYTCYPGKNEMTRVNFNGQKQQVTYGCAWGGQSDVISTIMKPYQILGPENKPMPAPRIPVVYETMNPQDAIDFALYTVRTTIDTIRFQARPKTVGGPIDVLLLTPTEARWIQKKELHGSP